MSTVLEVHAGMPGRAFEDFAVGDCFGCAVRIEERHLVQGAQLIGDLNPLHVDEAFARGSRFGGRILHGVLTSAIMSAPFGNLVAGTAVAYLEHNARFLAPVKIGDQLRIEWRVLELIAKSARGAGLVAAACEARNERAELVATATGKMLVAMRQPAG